MSIEKLNPLNNTNEHAPVTHESIKDVPTAKIETAEDVAELVAMKTNEATTASEDLITHGDTALDHVVKNIGASPDDVVEEKSLLSQISGKIKDNLRSFVMKVSMVSALGGAGGHAEAMATDPPTDKEKGKVLAPKENVVYISDPEEYKRRSEAYADSLALYNNHLEITKNLLNQGYFNSGTLEEKASRNNNLMFGLNGLLNHKEAKEFSDFVKNTKESKDKYGFRKESKSLSSVLDFVPDQINESLGRQLFSENIQPQGMSHYEWRNKTLSGWYNDFQKARSGEVVKEGDVRMVADYSNVKPKQKVAFKEVPLVRPPKQKEVKREKEYTDRAEYQKAMRAYKDSLEAVQTEKTLLKRINDLQDIEHDLDPPIESLIASNEIGRKNIDEKANPVTPTLESEGKIRPDWYVDVKHYKEPAVIPKYKEPALEYAPIKEPSLKANSVEDEVLETLPIKSVHRYAKDARNFAAQGLPRYNKETKEWEKIPTGYVNHGEGGGREELEYPSDKDDKHIDADDSISDKY